jgi:hypothetical protein
MQTMKNMKTRLMIAAAVLAAAAGTASAQTYRAEIPLSFRAAGAQMLPGTYDIQLNRSTTGTPYVKLTDRDNGKMVLLMPRPSTDVPKAWEDKGHPVIAFDCTESDCALKALWNGTAEYTYSFAAPKAHHSEHHAALKTVDLRATE